MISAWGRVTLRGVVRNMFVVVLGARAVCLITLVFVFVFVRMHGNIILDGPKNL